MRKIIGSLFMFAPMLSKYFLLLLHQNSNTDVFLRDLRNFLRASFLKNICERMLLNPIEKHLFYFLTHIVHGWTHFRNLAVFAGRFMKCV